MIDLLVSLQEVEQPAHRPPPRSRTTLRERRSLRSSVALVRDILPAEVLKCYDQMKRSDSDLLHDREVFAMAVLVATYRCLSPRRRKKLVAHFATQSRPETLKNGNGKGHRIDRRLQRTQGRQFTAHS
jgi:hypothetical protein